MKTKDACMRLAGMILLSGLFWIISCKPEADPDPGTPDNPGNPAGINPDKVSDYLSFTDAAKVTGRPPAAPDGPLKIDVRDTLYLAKGHPYKARISVLHDTLTSVTGFYIWVDGLSQAHYYNIPAVALEAKDSISVVYIGFDAPENEFTYPLTFTIHIQPHGPGGNPLDQFTRRVTIEDPAGQDQCDIYTEDGHAWKWLYTEVQVTGGSFRQITAPWFSATYSLASGGYYYAKCCIEDPDFGLIEAYPGDPTREGICNERNPLYKRVFIDGAYSLKPYEYLFIFRGGNFIHYSATLTANFVPQKSRICDLFAYYERTYTEYTKTGTHTYTPGAGSVQFTTTVAEPPFGPPPPFGTVTNTCHLLIFTFGAEQKATIVYQKYPGLSSTNPPPDPMNYLRNWFDF
jgi:hypothetical protein